jgi:DNA-binding CsgD family transcriptional regulator
VSEENGRPPDELAPRRKRRRRRPARPENRLVKAHAAQVATLVTSAEAKLEREAVEMRLRGLMYREIAERLGITYETAVRTISRVMRREAAQDQDTDPNSVEAVRQMELGRLDRLWSVWFPRALGNPEEGLEPNMAAATYCLKVMKRRAEYLGLDREEKAPQFAVNLTANVLQHAAEAARAPEELEALERVARLFAHGAIEGEAVELPPPPAEDEPEPDGGEG